MLLGANYTTIRLGSKGQWHSSSESYIINSDNTNAEKISLYSQNLKERLQAGSQADFINITNATLLADKIKQEKSL